jgi:hypothetical protein
MSDTEHSGLTTYCLTSVQPVDVDFLAQHSIYGCKVQQSQQPIDDVFGLLVAPPTLPTWPAPASPRHVLSPEVDRLRLALDLTHQPVPSSLNWNAPFSDFSDHSAAFFGGGAGFGLAGFGAPYQRPPQEHPRAFPSMPLETPDASWKRTLFELHHAYRTSRRRARNNPTYETPVPEPAVSPGQHCRPLMMHHADDALRRSLFLSSYYRSKKSKRPFYDSSTPRRINTTPTLVPSPVSPRKTKPSTTARRWTSASGSSPADR